MTRDEQLAWLRLQAECGCPDDPCEHTDAEPPDAVTAAAMRIVGEHGWYYDPPFTPETVLRLVELVGADPVPWFTVDDNGQAVRMVVHQRLNPRGEPVPLDDPTGEALYRAVPVDQDGSEG